MDELSIYLIDLLKENRLIRFEELKNILENIIEIEKLNDFYKGIQILESNRGFAGYTSTGIVKIFNQNIKNQIEKEYEFYKSLGYKIDYFVYYNYFLTKTLLHEVRHIIQERDKDKTNKNEFIYNTTGSLYTEKEIQFYDLFHSYYPVERDSDLYSYNKVLEVFRNLDYVSDYELKIMQIILITRLLKGYKIKSPYQILIREKERFGLETINSNIEFNFEERLNYGLELNKEELKLLIRVKGEIERNIIKPKDPVKERILK